MKYKTMDIDKELNQQEFILYSIEDRQKAIIALLELFELSKDNKKVFEGLKQFEKTIKALIELNKDKALKTGKAKMIKSKSFLVLKKGKLDELKKTKPELFKKTTRSIFKYI